MFNYLKKGFKSLQNFFSYFYQGLRHGLLTSYIKAFCQQGAKSLTQLNHFLHTTSTFPTHFKDANILKLQKSTAGLYALFSPNPLLSYSVLLPVLQTCQVDHFKRCLNSVCNQSIQPLEILIGFASPPSEVYLKIIKEYQNGLHQLKFFDFSSQTHDAISMTNHLAQKSTRHFLFIMQCTDWIRPDLFFRYEQTLRVFQEPEKVVLYCDCNQINDRGYFVPLSEYHQPSQLHFPYFFRSMNERGVLVPKNLWEKIEGLSHKYPGAEFENLLLQLDLAGAFFQHIPLCLYSMRSKQSLKNNKSQDAFLQALKEYIQTKNLDWEVEPGFESHTVRAIPALQSYCVQVIIPFKDQKELTLKCLQSVIKQQNVHIKITAVDNQSTDSSISQTIMALGGEVIRVNEPFNFSRLNNLAVQKTQTAQECDVVVFLNNDVELDPGALSEMLRWIDQPLIGMVGCRLHFPDGTLQHGGILLESSDLHNMLWKHAEKYSHFNEMTLTKSLGFFDAVTAACAMMKKDIFQKIGGFDEVWYPNGYSDTYLAIKLKGLGLKCFYTPYAFGVHHESYSRKVMIEDYENKWWLHHLLICQNKTPFAFKSFSEQESKSFTKR